MSIHKRWSKYTKTHISAEPDTYGVFEIGDIETGAVLYIGEGKIRTSLIAHTPDGGRKKHVSVFGSSIVGEFGYRFELTGTREKGKHKWHNMLASFKKEYGSLPRFNQRQEKGQEVLS